MELAGNTSMIRLMALLDTARPAAAAPPSLGGLLTPVLLLTSNVVPVVYERPASNPTGLTARV